MKLNSDKSHLLNFGERNNDVSVQIGATTITEFVEEKLLGVTLDKNLQSLPKLLKKIAYFPTSLPLPPYNVGFLCDYAVG